jgi:NAD(P)H dehydrogenase (quinone)
VIVVTGANGQVGRLVVERLLERVDASDIGVSVRDEGKAVSLQEKGVSVRRADFDQPDTLPAAFAGADTVFVNGTNFGVPPARRGAQHAAALRAAQASGATRIVATGWLDLENCRQGFAADFPGTERVARDWDGEWTILRLSHGIPAALARDVLWARKAGELVAPAGDTRVTTAAVPDLAEAVANVLVGTGHARRTYELTGPDTVGWDDLATLAGNSVPYRPISDDEFRTTVRDAGWPEPVIDQLIDLYGAFRDGWINTPTGDLATLLGRQPVRSIDAVNGAL